MRQEAEAVRDRLYLWLVLRTLVALGRFTAVVDVVVLGVVVIDVPDAVGGGGLRLGRGRSPGTGTGIGGRRHELRIERGQEASGGDGKKEEV